MFKFSIFSQQICKHYFRNLPPNNIPNKILLEYFFWKLWKCNYESINGIKVARQLIIIGSLRFHFNVIVRVAFKKNQNFLFIFLGTFWVSCDIILHSTCWLQVCFDVQRFLENKNWIFLEFEAIFFKNVTKYGQRINIGVRILDECLTNKTHKNLSIEVMSII